MGIDYERVWVIGFNNAIKTENTDSLNLFYETLLKNIQSIPQILEASYTSDNIPFYQNMSTSGLTFNGKYIDRVNWYTVSSRYGATLNIPMLEGHWYTKDDMLGRNQPVVINRNLKEKLVGSGSAIGKLIGSEEEINKRVIIGVAENVKVRGDYAVSGLAMYMNLDTAAHQWVDRILVKVTPDADAAFEGHLYKTLAGYLKNSNIEIEHLTRKRELINLFNLVPMIVLLIVACFLIINVALGLFGVLWYNINMRRGEIGLRRAVGATGKSVAGQLVGESMIIATLSMVIGVFFAAQFPLLNVFDLPAGVYIAGIVLSVLFIYGLVLICSLYPGRQAAGIYPAVALHED
jgi:putative ABC transport system permease protein